MFFIRGMVTGKWICFYAVRKVTDNGRSIGEGREYKYFRSDFADS